MSDAPLDDLTAALRRLHRDAGEPSTHEIAKKIKYSHTTVAQALKPTRRPTWPVLEALVKHLGGDLGVFRAYWIAVRDIEDPLPLPHNGQSGIVQSAKDETGAHSEDHLEGSVDGRVVLRWKTKLETIEFFDEGLAWRWIKARMQRGDSDEQP